MKITVLQSHRSLRRYRQQGLTLIEVSLVIALLLGLITVLFLGIGAYREGADKAKCKMQVTQVQKAVRAHASFNNLSINSGLDKNIVFGVGKLIEAEPTCPSGGTYAVAVPAVVPELGKLYYDCNYQKGTLSKSHNLGETDTTTEW